MSYYGRYVPVADRRAKAKKKVAKMLKKGETPMPIAIDGRKIAKTFWGDAWCKNLENYSDYANRLPRGRTYVRNGSVVDLRIKEGEVRALVAGSSVYRVRVQISPLKRERWEAVRAASSGKISSVVELLQGQLSDGVMALVTDPQTGLFPSPREIQLSCSCPDWATMCKHVAATLYGVGARLDHAPRMLFELRGVDPDELIKDAISQGIQGVERAPGRRLASDDLGEIFGVDIDLGDPPKKPSTNVPPDEPSTSTGRSGSSAQRDDDDTWVLIALGDEPGLSRRALSELLSLDETRTKRTLARLRKRGALVFRGAGRAGGYYLAE